MLIYCSDFELKMCVFILPSCMDSDECCTVNAVVAVAILVSLSLEERWAGGGEEVGFRGQSLYIHYR